MRCQGRGGGGGGGNGVRPPPPPPPPILNMNLINPIAQIHVVSSLGPALGFNIHLIKCEMHRAGGLSSFPQQFLALIAGPRCHVMLSASTCLRTLYASCVRHREWTDFLRIVSRCRKIICTPHVIITFNFVRTHVQMLSGTLTAVLPRYIAINVISRLTIYRD